MPMQGPPWTEFLSCHVCFNMFDVRLHRPISLGCGHTVCKTCLNKLLNNICPFDQSSITCNVNDLPVNYALLQLVGAAIPECVQDTTEEPLVNSEKRKYYDSAKKCIEDLAVYLKSETSEKGDSSPEDEETKTNLTGTISINGILTRPMQRKLVSLVNCQLIEEEGRSRAMRAARSLGERTVTELILQHQNPHQLSANLWAAVRARGCQFLGPAMQEEVLKLILLVLEDASALSRKVLVLFVVQHLEESYPQASKTAIGHVVQLLYRASCFKVTKREETSSVMQLKEEFRTYDALRREHDSQIVQIAMEAGLRISPEQWSSLLYGDASHKSHMQSIIDKLQTPQSFSQSINELAIALQRTGDPCNLQRLRPHLEFLANVDPSPEAPSPTWENLEAVLKALRTVVQALVDFFTNYSQKKELLPLQNARYKTSMCRDQTNQGMCPRGTSCTFAHSQEELEKYRARSKKLGIKGTGALPLLDALSLKEKAELERVNKATSEKLAEYSKNGGTIGKSVTHLPAGSDPSLSIDTPVAQPMKQPLSPKSLSPPGRSLSNPNSGIPSVNTTPSIATPAQYRKPSLGIGPSVKETYFHQRMPQGTTKMTPCEISAVEAMSFNRHQYHLNPQTHPRTTGQYPPSYCRQEPGCHLPPHAWMEAHSLGHALPDQQWGGEPHYCTLPPKDSVYMYGSPQHYCPSHETPLPTQDYPGYNRHIYYQRAAPPMYQGHGRGVNPGHETGYSNQDAQWLNDLHARRNTIIAHLSKTSSCPSPGAAAHSKQQYSNSNNYMPSSKTTYPEEPTCCSFPLAQTKSVADAYVAARTSVSLDNSCFLNEQESSYTSSSYVPWSSDDSDVLEKIECKSDPCVSWWTDDIRDKPFDMEGDTDNDDDAKNIMSWLEEEKKNLECKNQIPFSRQQKAYSEEDPAFIPFEPARVSKFGPISRMARAKSNNTDPVQVTANQTLKKIKPITAVTQLSCPVPVAAPVSSRFSVKEIPTRMGQVADSRLVSKMNMFTLGLPSHDHVLMSNDPTRLSRQQMQREVDRLELWAQDALTENESLALELKAIELKISLQAPDNPDSTQGKVNRVCNSMMDRHAPPSVRPSDPALTAEEQKKLRHLTSVGGSEQRSEQQERILSQLLKIKDLGNITKRYHYDH